METPQETPQEAMAHLRGYISAGWHKLYRSHGQLLQAAKDPKLAGATPPWLVYVSGHEDLEAVAASLRGQLPASDLAQIELRRLPADHRVSEHGLLYLPHGYVVPGGRFNEQYGWDTYWHVLGLLREGLVDMARENVDNHLYEIRHYGAVLNANRTYFLSRSQPPLLTGMVRAVFAQTGDRQWLRAALPAIEAYYRYWEGPHLTPETGLARYYDHSDEPAPEVLADEVDDEGRTHYERIQRYLRAHPGSVADYGYDLSRLYDAAGDRLTPECYRADRTMRESGFDPSDRFGRFNLGVLNMNPVCLNALLYMMEVEAAEICSALGEGAGAAGWQARAERRKAAINELLWDEQAGLYCDYDVVQGRRRDYPFATTFYPLWAGIASEAQAARVIDNLALFEMPGGVQTSTNVSGSQWDAPFGWAPLQLIAVNGLRRYGAEAAARRIAVKFVSLVAQEFRLREAIFEKYNVVERSSYIDTAYGYAVNVVGFGWTNGTVAELLATFPGLEGEVAAALEG